MTTALLLPLLLASAQDVVRFPDGKVLWGAVVETNAEALRFRPPGDGAAISIPWSALSAEEKRRLQAEPAGFLDGVRLAEDGRETLGVVVREDADQLLVKTAARRTPVAVHKTPALRRTPLKVLAEEVYAADELIDARVAGLKPGDAEGLLTAGREAARRGRHERADDLFRRAAAASPAKKAEVDLLLAENAIVRREVRAFGRLAEARRCAEKEDFEGALRAARSFLGDFPGSAAVAQNASLAEELPAWEARLKQERLEASVEKIPALWRSRRSSLLSKAAAGKAAEAQERLAALDATIAKELGELLKLPADEIVKAWEGRDEKIETVPVGPGSWILNGGPDGGLDYQPPPAPPAPPEPEVKQYITIPVRDSQGRVLYYVTVPAGGSSPTPRARAGGLPLDTREEWWARAKPADRKALLEAEYVRLSARVRRLEDDSKDCFPCAGSGSLRALRQGETIQVLCPRCHGTRKDVVVRYR